MDAIAVRDGRQHAVLRRGLAALLLMAVAAALLPGMPARAQSASAPVPAQLTASTGEDFATMAYGDPQDFRNGEDIRLHKGMISDNTIDPRIEDGELRFSARGGASLITFLFPGYGGALYMERDGGALPIDADRYTHLALRIFSPSQRVMSFIYDRCLDVTGTQEFCRDTTSGIILEAGWNTVVGDLRAMTAGNQHRWDGQVRAFRMSNDVADGYRVDYIRLQTAPEMVDVTWAPTTGSELFWDLDTDVSNNTPENPGWGYLGVGGRAAFPAGAMAAGDYRFYARSQGGAPSAYSQPLQVLARPAPIVLDPDLAGGEDFATVTLGKPWDFSTPNDVIASQNLTDVSFGPEGLQATNAAQPHINDPYFYLRMGPSTTGSLDAERYHRLTVHTTYDGPFNLDDVAGGGTHGRLSWTTADRDQDRVIEGNKIVSTRELVHYPHQASFTVDLKTPPDPSFVHEDDGPMARGWAADSPVTHLRYDPNEDRGPRRWRVARIELRATDETRDGAFDIRWRDGNVQPVSGVTVALAYRPESGGDWRPIASGIAQQPGVNTHRWDTRTVPTGRYVVQVTASDAVAAASAISTGPVDVRTPRQTIRLAGGDRLSTAVALSRAAFPDGAPAAVLARSTQFPDALAAGPLAAAAGGPLLLNSTGGLEEPVRAELVRLGVRTVYVMGGESAQSGAVVDAVRAIGGIRVERLAGPNRFATAAAAADEAAQLWRADGNGRAGADEVIVALGEDFPDALAAGPLAGFTRQPLLLTGRGLVPAPTLAALDALGARRVTVVGGPNAVSDSAVAQLREGGRTVMRIAGATRFETAELVATAAVNAGADARAVIVASGRQFPDALAAGPAVQGLGGVLLLTERDVLPAGTGAWVGSRRPMRLLHVAGGAAAVSNAVEEQLIGLGR